MITESKLCSHQKLEYALQAISWLPSQIMSSATHTMIARPIQVIHGYATSMRAT